MTEDREYLIGARIDNLVESADPFKASDPFNKAWSELKSYNGIDNNFKRRVNRLLEKASANDPSQGYLDSARAEQHGLGNMLNFTISKTTKSLRKTY